MRTSTRNTQRLNTIIDAWSTLSPTTSLAGMTLEEFKLAVSPALHARRRLAEAKQQVAAALAERDNADREAMPIADRVVSDVVAMVPQGSDSALYAAMGYVRKSARRSGLTRRKAAPPESPSLKPSEG